MQAMLSGQSPQAFLMGLAQNNPQLAGLDLNNLEATARNLCKQHNVDVDKAKAEVSSKLSNK